MFLPNNKESTVKALILASALMAGAPLALAGNFQLASPDIAAHSLIEKRFEFNGFGCNGENRSPAHAWRNPPAGTQSFAVTVYDPDAPTGSGWWHWSVINLPADTRALPANAGATGDANLPQGARQIRIDYGVAAWGGMCPPEGDKAHRYIFKVHALKTPHLEIPADATAALAGYMINANSIGTASFTARYGRKAQK